MSRRINHNIILSALLAAGLSACGNTKSDESAPSSTPQMELSQATRAAISEALGAYEAVRAKLAADDTSGLAVAADQIASAATKALGTAPGRLQPLLQTMAEQAKKLAATTTDMEQTRVAFGEVSRAVVGLLVAEQALQRGRFVFHCPMAKGYKKWVQIDAKLANPFMGKKMLECGSKSTWEV